MRVEIEKHTLFQKSKKHINIKREKDKKIIISFIVFSQPLSFFRNEYEEHKWFAEHDT